MPKPSFINCVTVPGHIRYILADIERLRKELTLQALLIEDADVLNALQVCDEALNATQHSGQLATGILMHLASLEFVQAAEQKQRGDVMADESISDRNIIFGRFDLVRKTQEGQPVTPAG